MLKKHTPARTCHLLMLLVAALAMICTSIGRADDEPPAKEESANSQGSLAELSAAHALASVNGKYRMLLRQFKAEADRETVGDFKEDGLQNRVEYKGETDLPPGHWVYVFPYWYIWRDLAAQPLAQRNWGPEQMNGEPNTDEAGDVVTAWASRSQDGGDEWILLEYAESVLPRAVQIHETYNPGAVYKVCVFTSDGREEAVWTGEDPTPTNAEKGISLIPFRTDFAVNRLKVYLKSREVPGWNEIDAVGVRDATGQTHWAAVAHASTTYAEQSSADPFEVVDPAAALTQRMMQLEQQVAELQQVVVEVKALQQSIEELKRLVAQKESP